MKFFHSSFLTYSKQHYRPSLISLKPYGNFYYTGSQKLFITRKKSLVSRELHALQVRSPLFFLNLQPSTRYLTIKELEFLFN